MWDFMGGIGFLILGRRIFTKFWLREKNSSVLRSCFLVLRLWYNQPTSSQNSAFRSTHFATYLHLQRPFTFWDILH